MGCLTPGGFTKPAEIYDREDEDELTSEAATITKAEIKWKDIYEGNKHNKHQLLRARADLDEHEREVKFGRLRTVERVVELQLYRNATKENAFDIKEPSTYMYVCMMRARPAPPLTPPP